MTEHWEPPPLGEHTLTCLEPEFEWQQPIWEGLPIRGRRVTCGAISIDRSTQTSRGAFEATPDNTRRRTRRWNTQEETA